MDLLCLPKPDNQVRLRGIVPQPGHSINYRLAGRADSYRSSGRRIVGVPTFPGGPPARPAERLENMTDDKQRAQRVGQAFQKLAEGSPEVQASLARARAKLPSFAAVAKLLAPFNMATEALGTS